MDKVTLTEALYLLKVLDQYLVLSDPRSNPISSKDEHRDKTSLTVMLVAGAS